MFLTSTNMYVYKLFTVRKGKLYPLFINKKQQIEEGVWLDAECFPTKGFTVRKGWHCTLQPIAPHLKLKLKSGEERVWVKCEVRNFEYYNRPESQGGTWVLAQQLKVLHKI